MRQARSLVAATVSERGQRMQETCNAEEQLRGAAWPMVDKVKTYEPLLGPDHSTAQ